MLLAIWIGFGNQNQQWAWLNYYQGFVLQLSDERVLSDPIQLTPPPQLIHLYPPQHNYKIHTYKAKLWHEAFAKALTSIL